LQRQRGKDTPIATVPVQGVGAVYLAVSSQRPTVVGPLAKTAYAFGVCGAGFSSSL